MSVQCKSYLLKDDAKEPTEIRSFRLDEGAVSNYDYLRKKLATIFPSLGWEEDGSALKLLWRDSAGDLVTFSSDEELLDALGEVGVDGIFKVYIKHATKKHGDFPWEAYIKEMWKSLNTEAQNERNCPGFTPFSHPYARRGGCGGKRGCFPPRGGCGPQRRGFPAGLFFDATPSAFPGFHAEVWAFGGDESGGCCWKSQNETQQQSAPSQKEDRPQQQDEEEPSTSSS